jgi:low affinity Fe/Cu permease
MKNSLPLLGRFLNRSAKMAANPISFVVALFVVAVWFSVGLVLGFSDTWLLLLNTVATLNASLMVFIIQNSQSRESKALHLKIDELLRVTKEARNELIAIEELEEEELEKIRDQLNSNSQWLKNEK